MISFSEQIAENVFPRNNTDDEKEEEDDWGKKEQTTAQIHNMANNICRTYHFVGWDAELSKCVREENCAVAYETGQNFDEEQAAAAAKKTRANTTTNSIRKCSANA